MKKLLFSLLIINCLVAMAQLPPSAEGYIDKRVQCFTPNAQAALRLAQIPTTLFNGLTNISVPLTSIKVRDYELPISLKYHSGGNKPDIHPGWVGEGWYLEAGGSINRIVNGMKDETSMQELQFLKLSPSNADAGYLIRNVAQSYPWDSQSALQSLIPGTAIDNEPDEFCINAAGIHASFYFVKKGSDPPVIKIKSKGDANFQVTYATASDNNASGFYTTSGLTTYPIKAFEYIQSITITKNDGTVLVFGGDPTSIEFSYQLSTLNVDASFVRSANTWHLKTITTPKRDVITFTYARSGMPIVESKHRYEGYFYSSSTKTTSLSYSYNKAYDADYKYYMIAPCYLSKITTNFGNEIDFYTSQTIELPCNYNVGLFTNNVFTPASQVTTGTCNISDFWSKNYYLKLDQITFQGGKMIKLNYNNDANSRLQLKGLSFLDKIYNPIENYSFDYNPLKLPAYNSNMSDHWGYYNGIPQSGSTYADLLTKRNPDAINMQAEILQKITYPTGGSTTFQFENHTYNYVFTLDPGPTSSLSFLYNALNAGGLRIKQITDWDQYKPTMVRTYAYGTGILSGTPSYVRQYFITSPGYSPSLPSVTSYNVPNDYCIIESDTPYGLLPSTEGNNVTYASVTESKSGGESTRYTFFDYGDGLTGDSPTAYGNITGDVSTNTFTSRSLERGLLRSVLHYQSPNVLSKSTEYTYNSDVTRFNDYVEVTDNNSSFGNLYFRNSASKIYTYYPYVVGKVEKVYSPEFSDVPVINESDYTYNTTYRLLSTQTDLMDGIKEQKTIYLYPTDISQKSSALQGMISNNYIGYPIEITSYVNNKAKSGVLSIYGNYDNTYQPGTVYHLQVAEPVTFVPYDGNTMSTYYNIHQTEQFSYGAKGNLNEKTAASGLKTAYLWGYNYFYPIAEIINSPYSTVSTALGGETSVTNMAAQTNPDFTNVDALRSNASLQNAFISTYKYLPFVGKSQATDPRGIITYYNYDNYNRPSNVQDYNHNLLKVFNYK